MSIRDRLDTLSRAELAGLVAVVVVTLAGAGLWYARSLPQPVALAEAPGAVVPASSPGAGVVASAAPGASASTGASASAAPPGVVIVDVAGEVRRPGVYELPAGSRVIDAIEMAGGPRGGAFLAALNLAAPLADGQQVLVPREGDAGVQPAVPGAPAAPGAPGSSGGLVNVNTADEATLETLPGVGEVLAAAIVQHRTEHGPFTSVDQLEEVSGIGPSTLEELRPHVTV
jgi:competence protein ComEA